MNIGMEGRLDFVRRGMAVSRYHQNYTAVVDRVGQHSAGVAMFLILMNERLPSPALLAAALTHDLPECVVGDIPSPAKRAMGMEARKDLDAQEFRLLTDNDLYFPIREEEKLQLKLADCFDGLMFCIEERRRGNTEICKVADTYISYIHTAMSANGFDDRAAAIRNILMKQWRDANDCQ